MPRLAQTYLGASPQQALCILPYPRRQRFVPTGECFMSWLPDELFTQIFEYLAPPDHFYHESKYGECLDYPCVNNRWLRLYQPILYRKIDLGYSGWKSAYRLKRLARTLGQCPHLADHVRAIRIFLPTPKDAYIPIIAEIVACCRLLREFSENTEYSALIWPIFHAASGLPRLEKLWLAGQTSGPALQMLLTHFDLPTLKEVCLHRFGVGIDDGPGAPWYPTANTPHDDLIQILANTRHHNVTTMDLSDPSAPPHITEIFMQWPAHLTNFSMDFLANSACGREYTFEAVQRLLDLHSQSLRNVRLGIIPCWHTQNGIPDFSAFPRLQSLQLSKYNLLSEPPYLASPKLRAPSLRHLRIYFNTEDQHSESAREFATEQVRWLNDFVSHKASETKVLETIFIGFSPETHRWSINPDHDTIWPWDYLEQAAEALAHQNITLRYSTPGCTREEWRQTLSVLREARNAAIDPETIDAHFGRLGVR
ncbi:hypothetical protein OEA41_009699 [Lepraria neglecta]|uniref:F-box domain-containing protein n=1 Tax=Lepraria neglecta TaxID=209136 RepID=A0AAD9Z4T0_9LECA|nr:hypothetical protein OEA41_009699 [Lepraria neglecta]